MSSRLDARYDVVIAGAGLAGAATAFMVARARSASVLLVEQETTLARHSSGRNAGIVRRSTGDQELDRFCDEGAAFLAAPPPDFAGTTGFRRTGGFLVVTREQAQAWARSGVERSSVTAFARALPDYVLPDGAEILFAPDDGVADSSAVVAGFVAGAQAQGATVHLGAPLGQVEVVQGAVRSVEVGGRRIGCGVLVDACGAWSPSFVAALGAADDGVRSTRRHLLQTAPDGRLDSHAPWVWDHLRDFYARPEAGGLLLCACDESPDPPGDCKVDPTQAAAIRAKFARAWPRAAGAATMRFWAGHRTRRPDERFVVGPLLHPRGVQRVAGLGGHGLTASAAVGAAAARMILS